MPYYYFFWLRSHSKKNIYKQRKIVVFEVVNLVLFLFFFKKIVDVLHRIISIGIVTL